jgi:hypothetical protein
VLLGKSVFTNRLRCIVAQNHNMNSEQNLVSQCGYSHVTYYGNKRASVSDVNRYAIIMKGKVFLVLN